jgi:hypothetical protein
MQLHTSPGIAFFREKMQKRYHLEPYSDPSGAALFFGLYSLGDYQLLQRHTGPASVIWAGTDALLIPSFGEYSDLLRRPGLQHIAISSALAATLAKHNIQSRFIPLSPTPPQADPRPMGQSIYWYHGNRPEFYGSRFIDDIKRRTGLRVIGAAHNTYCCNMLKTVYESCFIGLRLTPHDGLPNTVLELGLMGRPSIFNGDVPHSIPWQNIDDICQNILGVYHNRDLPNEYIAFDVRDFLLKGERDIMKNP